MASLLLAAIIGTAFAILATQNTVSVPVHILGYSWTGIPLYIVAVGSLLLGLVVSFLLSLFNWATSSLTIHGKEARAQKAESTVANLKARIAELEAKNADIKSDLHETKEIQAAEHPSPIRRFTQSFSR